MLFDDGKFYINISAEIKNISKETPFYIFINHPDARLFQDCGTPYELRTFEAKSSKGKIFYSTAKPKVEEKNFIFLHNNFEHSTGESIELMQDDSYNFMSKLLIRFPSTLI